MAQQEARATHIGLAANGLLSLVDELLLNIIEQIDDHDRLRNLAATCARLQALVEPHIWRTLIVTNGAHARRIAAALDSRDTRSDYIYDISIRYKDAVRDGIEELNHWLSLMSKLRRLHLETPCPNNLEWQTGAYFDGWSKIDYKNLLSLAVYPRQGIVPALPMLQSLTLHGHGAGGHKFHLGNAIAMFQHPTLRTITLSCLNFAHGMDWADLTKQDWKANSTPLQSLTLIECNVDVRFLDIVLRLPKALRELSIGERLHTFAECIPSMDSTERTSSPLFLTALQRQAASLKRLVHIGGHMAHLTARQTDPDGAAKLRSLVNLEHLELGIESHLYFYLRQNGFPPSLKSLKMVDSALSLNAGQDLHSLADIVFRSLISLVTEHLPPSLPRDFTLQLRFSESYFFRLLAMADPFEQQHLLADLFLDRPSIYKVARIMKSYRSHFRISREVFLSGNSYIPPYMYGEEVPTERLIYDSDDFWRLNGVDYRVVDDEQFQEELKGRINHYICLQCRKHGKTVTECLNQGDGSECLPCVQARYTCKWERDSEGELVSTAVDSSSTE